MDTKTKALFGKSLLHYASIQDYIDWAIEMLLEDYDSPSLRILAGLYPDSCICEANKYFFYSIKELGIKSSFSWEFARVTLEDMKVKLSRSKRFPEA